jgi:hypothetical protein
MSKLGRLALCGAMCLTLTVGLGCKKEDEAMEDDASMATESMEEPMMSTEPMSTEMGTEMSTEMSTDMSTEQPPAQ